MNVMQLRVVGNELGFSIIEFVIASMMSVIIISVCYSLVAFQYNQLRKVRALYVQNILLTKIKSAANAESLAVSGADPVNVKLQTCLAGIDGTVAGCNSGDTYDVRLFDSGGALIAGFRTDPVGYNLDAQTCVVGAMDCLFTLKTYFRVQCPESAANIYFIPPTCPTPPGLIELFYEFDAIADLGPNRILGIKPVIGSVIIKM